MIYDLIIIGAGPAGITASVYAARKGLKFLVIAENVGGQAALSGDIENYTGYQFITGPELASKFEEHIKKYGVLLKEGEKVQEIKKEGGNIRVKTNKDTYEAKAAIVASGARWKELGVPGEKEFKNKGVTYCATCDGPLFAGKRVAVIGGGNSGLEAAIQLSKIAGHVYIIEANPDLKGDDILKNKISIDKNITVFTGTKVIEISGDKFVNLLKIKREDKEEGLSVEGIFVEIGLRPNSDFIDSVKKNKWGEMEINSKNETNVPGIFAAGDVSNVSEKQIIIAAGEGSKATLSAFKYIARLK